MASCDKDFVRKILTYLYYYRPIIIFTYLKIVAAIHNSDIRRMTQKIINKSAFKSYSNGISERDVKESDTDDSAASMSDEEDDGGDI